MCYETVRLNILVFFSLSFLKLPFRHHLLLLQYFEHTVEAIFAGEICLAVFRGLARLPIESIWSFTPLELKLVDSNPMDVAYGMLLGLIGAFTAYLYAQLHQRVMNLFQYFDLIQNDSRAVYRALLGCSVIIVLAMFIPHTMFWGELEIQTIATMDQASTLSHVWPTTGLINFELTDSPMNCFILAIAKLIAISFTVAGGYRGGYIFPAMTVGCALGRAIYPFMPFIPVQLCCLCLAASINVAITRTSIATTLILAYLSGEQNAITAILASSLISLFATGYMPFIKTQMARADIDQSLYHSPSKSFYDDGDDDDDDYDECDRPNVI